MKLRRIKGRIQLRRNGVLLFDRPNLIVNAGMPAYAECIAGYSSTWQAANLGFGTGNVAVTVNDTDLTGPQKYYNNLVPPATFPSSGTVTFSFAITASDYAAYGATITELGMYSNPTAVLIPASSGFSRPAWAATSSQPVGNLIGNTSGTFRSTTPPAWPTSTVVAVGRLIIDSNGNLQEVTTGGTTGGSHPSWSTSLNGTTTDNTATWTCKAVGAYTPTTGGSAPTWVVAATGNFTYDGTVAWTFIAAAVIPQPMLAHALVPAFAFTGAASYSGSWSITF
jgi:hypothetical protein